MRKEKLKVIIDLSVIFIPAIEGGYYGYVEHIPEAISHGKTMKQARENLIIAVERVLGKGRKVG